MDSESSLITGKEGTDERGRTTHCSVVYYAVCSAALLMYCVRPKRLHRRKLLQRFSQTNQYINPRFIKSPKSYKLLLGPLWT